MLTEVEQISAIYEIYPRHVGRRAALKAIENAVKRLVKSHPLAGISYKDDPVRARRFLYKKAAEYAMSPAGQKPTDPEKDFRPHPATWFNQERMFDDFMEWQKPNGASNGKQIGTKAARTVDALRTLVERSENRGRSDQNGDLSERGVQPDDSGGVRARTIDGTV